MEEDIRNLVGNRLRFLRKQIGLSQEKFAFVVDLDRTYIPSIECGRRNVSIVNIEKIADALGCSVYEFFNAKEFKSLKANTKSKMIAKVAEKSKRKYK